MFKKVALYGLLMTVKLALAEDAEEEEELVEIATELNMCNFPTTPWD